MLHGAIEYNCFLHASEGEFHENRSDVNFIGAEEFDVPSGLRRHVPGEEETSERERLNGETRSSG